MSTIQTNKHLPPELCIESIDDILYSIGLCHHSVKDRPKRSKIQNPVLITIVLLTNILMRIVSNATDNETILLLMGDFLHYVEIKEYLNNLALLFALMALLSQTVYHYNHCIGVKPTFVRILQMLSGSITPSSVGLNHSTQVHQLLSIAKWLPLLRKNNAILIPIISSLFILGIYFSLFSFLSSVILSIYPILFTSLWGYYTFNLMSIQIFLFFIICKYFLIKLKERNRILKDENRMNTNRIRNILVTHDSLYRELNEYNLTFFSKFILIIWSILGFIIINLIYLIIFGRIQILLKITVIYLFIFYTIMFLFILSIASSVNSESNKTYKLLNSFVIKYNYNNNSKLDKKRKAFINIKVIRLRFYL